MGVSVELVICHARSFEERKNDFAALVISQHAKRIVDNSSIRERHVVVEDAPRRRAHISDFDSSHWGIREPSTGLTSNSSTESGGPPRELLRVTRNSDHGLNGRFDGLGNVLHGPSHLLKLQQAGPRRTNQINETSASCIASRRVRAIGAKFPRGAIEVAFRPERVRSKRRLVNWALLRPTRAITSGCLSGPDWCTSLRPREFAEELRNVTGTRRRPSRSRSPCPKKRGTRRPRMRELSSPQF
jgi:hypothetical protein